ncbi:amidohydrolase family protein [Chloroflexota bacterium]
MIIDFRCRIPTPEFNVVYERHEVTYFDRFNFQKPSSMTLDMFFKSLEEAGIDKVVSPARDLESTRGLKVPLEHIAEMQKTYPDKIIGFGGVDCLKGWQAAKDVEKAAELGLKGVMIDPGMNQVISNDKRLYPIYAKCQELKMPVIITCGPGDPRWSQVTPVGEVADDFPELTLIVSHTWPRIMDAIALSYKYPNFFFEVSGYFTWPSCDLLIDALNHRLIDNHLLFGSAFPYSPDLKRIVERFKKFFETVRHPEVMEKVFHGNAERILGL